MNPILSLAASAALVAPAFAQSVLHVDPLGGAGTFPDIASAVAAAAPGDLVLVATGSYGGFELDRGIVVAGDVGADVHVDGSVNVSGIPAGEEAVLHGLHIEFGLGGLFGSTLSVFENDGHVLLQDVEVTATPASLPLTGLVLVQDCASVTFASCVVDGRNTFLGIALYSGALTTLDSQLFLHGTTVHGATGGNGTIQTFEGDAGGAAVTARGGTALASDCVLVGGDGGFGNVLVNPGPGGDGGPAVRLHTGPGGGAPSFVALESTLEGGAGGGALAPAVPGSPGPVSDVNDGTLESPAAFARSYLAEAVVRDGETTTLGFRGQPFDLVFWILGLDAAPSIAYLPDVLGAFHPDPLVFRFFGLLDAQGEKDLSITLKPTGLPYLAFWEQALLYNDTEGFVASNPRFIAFLDAGL